MTQGKKLVLPTVFLSIVAMMAMMGTNTTQIAFAELDTTSEPVVKASEELQKNPLAMKILTEMEKLNAFIEKYKDVMPKAAYTKFVEKKPDYIQGVFWGMFDYMQGKVDSARAAMKAVLDNGGSLKEARDAYFEHASAKRVQLIKAVEDLNIQHGFADKL